MESTITWHKWPEEKPQEDEIYLLYCLDDSISEHVVFESEYSEYGWVNHNNEELPPGLNIKLWAELPEPPEDLCK